MEINKDDFWFCSECNDGPQLVALHPACSNCSHQLDASQAIFHQEDLHGKMSNIRVQITQAEYSELPCSALPGKTELLFVSNIGRDGYESEDSAEKIGGRDLIFGIHHDADFPPPSPKHEPVINICREPTSTISMSDFTMNASELPHLTSLITRETPDLDHSMAIEMLDGSAELAARLHVLSSIVIPLKKAISSAARNGDDDDPSDDSSSDSDCSTCTGSTDVTEASSVVADDVLTRARRLARYMVSALAGRLDWRAERSSYTNTPEDGESSKRNGSAVSDSSSDPADRPKKRKRTTQRTRDTRPPNGGDENEDDDEDGIGRSLKSTPEDAGFACPFFVNSPRRHDLPFSCRRRSWKLVRRLKQHICRVHKVYQCLRCGSRFSDKVLFLAHVRNEDGCQPRQLPPAFGVNQSQIAALNSMKSPRGRPEAEKWQAVYQIVFPEVEIIPSPYYSPSHLEEESVSENSPPKDRFWKNLQDILAKDLEDAFRRLIEDKSADSLDRQLKEILTKAISQARSQASSSQSPRSEAVEDLASRVKTRPSPETSLEQSRRSEAVGDPASMAEILVLSETDNAPIQLPRFNAQDVEPTEYYQDLASFPELQPGEIEFFPNAFSFFPNLQLQDDGDYYNMAPQYYQSAFPLSTSDPQVYSLPEPWKPWDGSVPQPSDPTFSTLFPNQAPLATGDSDSFSNDLPSGLNISPAESANFGGELNDKDGKWWEENWNM